MRELTQDPMNHVRKYPAAPGILRSVEMPVKLTVWDSVTSITLEHAHCSVTHHALLTRLLTITIEGVQLEVLK